MSVVLTYTGSPLLLTRTKSNKHSKTHFVSVKKKH